MAIKKDFIGQIFGRITVISASEKKGKHQYWVCKCRCGKEKISSSTNLLNGHVKSCGCLGLETFRGHRLTHGQSKTPEFKAWWRMISRCIYAYPENHNSNSHKYYVEKGIEVCERWKEKFENFLEDMGPMPNPRYSLERNENSKGYSLENCRWATLREQALNRSNSVFLTYKGIKKNLCTWADDLGVNRVTLRRTAIRLGSDEYAIEKFLHRQLK